MGKVLWEFYFIASIDKVVHSPYHAFNEGHGGMAQSVEFEYLLSKNSKKSKDNPLPLMDSAKGRKIERV